MDSKVSSELLDQALDIFSICNGLQRCELIRSLNVSNSAGTIIIKELLELECISIGAIQYHRIDGHITLRKGYLYEQDLPEDFRVTKRRHFKERR